MGSNSKLVSVLFKITPEKRQELKLKAIELHTSSKALFEKEFLDRIKDFK